jgi:hypothetical protein
LSARIVSDSRLKRARRRNARANQHVEAFSEFIPDLGQGEIIMRAGSCWILPNGIKHTVLDYSDDCEMLEIILPAEFDTMTLG